jgi:limonene-1,2-epoxide hydrolase
MTSDVDDAHKIAAFREMVRAWEAKEWRKCADLLAPDAALHSVMLNPIVGREAIYARMTEGAKPNKQVKLHVLRVGVIDGAVMSERIDEVILDGVSRKVPVVGIMEFDGPLISLWREYYDRPSLLRAQGREAELHTS